MKKISMLKLLALVAIANVFTGCGCKDKEQLYLPQDFKDCHIFPVGSWWVYAVNGIPCDTIELLSQNVTPPPVPDKKIGCTTTEKYYSEFYKSGSGSFEIEGQDYIFEHYYSYSVPNWHEGESNLIDLNKNFYFFIFYGGGISGMDHPEIILQSFQTKISGGYWLESISDTTFNGISTVLRVFRTFDLNELAEEVQQHIDSLPPFRTYYARGIGLIKKEMYNGDVWELQDFFINE